MDDVLDYEGERTLATKSKRFLNFIIDGILMLIFTFGVLFLVFALTDHLGLETEEESIGEKLIGVLMIVLMIAYFAVQEYFFNGKTIGKWMTHTRAVSLDGEKINFIMSLKRSTIRVIGAGIDPFTFLGKKTMGWHDLYSYTKVVMDEK